MIPSCRRMLEQEARSLLTRLIRIKPFVLNEPMLAAASLSPQALIGIEQYLAQGRHELKVRVEEFLSWLNDLPSGIDAEAAQRRFVFLRLRFNAVLTQLDMFSDVLTQRSEHENGVWLSGLDVASADALALPSYYTAPPVVCYLDRGVGAAIRRARTRLPGGGENPVAIIRVPRERMIGSGIASSLVHEVGHQGSVLLGLVPSLLAVVQREKSRRNESQVWDLLGRWLSEILADFWSVARVGVVSTLGLMGVVSLPRPFVFRMNLDDPHPMPWIRVKLSCAIGAALYPHSQWQHIAQVWEGYYPLDGLNEQQHQLIGAIEAAIPEFMPLLVDHRPASLHGRSLREVLAKDDRRPDHLIRLYQRWTNAPAQMYRAAPSLAFAVLGQAKLCGSISPEDESELIVKLLNHWAVRSTLALSAQCAALPARRARTSIN